MHNQRADNQRHIEAFQPGLLQRLKVAPRNIAVVYPRRIGDFVMATPAFRALRGALKEARITFIGLPVVEELVARSTSLDRFLAFPGIPGVAEQFFRPERLLSFFAQMQCEELDLAIQLGGSGVYTNPFTLMLGAKKTVGFIRANDSPGLLNAALPYPEYLSESERVLALVEFLGARRLGLKTDFPLLDADREHAAAVLTNMPSPLIGLQPGARHAIKRWPVERFVGVAQELQRRFGGTIIFLGGPDEVAALRSFREPFEGPCLNVAGSMPLAVMGALISRLNLLLTNDSGPAHIAYALNCPTVTVFGGTNPKLWGPPSGPFIVIAREIACRPCSETDCPIGYQCLNAVTVDEVVSAASLLIQSAPNPSLGLGKYHPRHDGARHHVAAE